MHDEEHHCKQEAPIAVIHEKCRGYDSHLEEANKAGGTRERVDRCVRDLDVIWSCGKIGIWLVFAVAVLGGIIGGLVSRVLPEIINAVLRIITKTG